MSLFAVGVVICYRSAGRSLSPLTCRPSPLDNHYIVLPVGYVGPAGLLGPFGCLAVVDRLGVQQSGPAVDLELLGRTSEE